MNHIVPGNYAVPQGKELRIAISGKSGCGNTTVSTMLAQRLGIKLINYTFRNLAKDIGFSLAEIIERAKTDDSFDRQVDGRQVALALEESCVLGSRLAVWMLKDADLKVFLLADEDVRARRILNREGGDLEEIKAFTAMRDREDSARYQQLYEIDNNDYGFCHLIIDTALHKPDEIVELILQELHQRGLVESC